MDSSERQAVVLALMDAMRSHQSWCGETHLQKCVYILQEALHIPFELEFVLYKHGPFSFDLRQLLGEMRARLLIDVKAQPIPYGPSLEVALPGDVYLTHRGAITAKYARAIELVAGRFGPRGVGELERLGTALYVTSRDPGTSPESRAAELARIKPHVAADAARAAVNEIDSLLCEIARPAA